MENRIVQGMSKCLESFVLNFAIIVQFLKNGFKSLPVMGVPGDPQPHSRDTATSELLGPVLLTCHLGFLPSNLQQQINQHCIIVPGRGPLSTVCSAY